MAGFLNLWSKTAASNSNADSTINWAEGQLPSTVNGSARAEMAAVASWRDDINGSLTTAGSANAYTVTTNIAFTALATGLMIAFKANHTNTGAATLAANSLTAKALRTQDDAALVAGQIVNNGQYFAKYDAAANGAAGAWLIQNPTLPAATQAEQEAGSTTSVFVSPGRQQYHPSAVKAWGRADAAGNIQASYNVESISDDGTGLITWGWNTDFSSANYSAIPGALSAGGFRVAVIEAQAAGTLQVQVYNNTPVAADPTNHTIIACGDHS